MKNPENPKIPGIGIYFFGISRGYPEVVAPKSLKTPHDPKKHFYILKTKKRLNEFKNKLNNLIITQLMLMLSYPLF